MSPEQKSLIRQTLQMIMQASIFRAVWSLPLPVVIVGGVAVFGVLFWLSS